WLERNSKTLGRLSVPNDVLRWDEALRDPDYPRFLRRVRDAYRDDPGYRAAVDSTIRTFLDRMVSRNPCVDPRKAFEGCLSYLIEECPVIQPMWAHQGYDHIVYPQPLLVTDLVREYADVRGGDIRFGVQDVRLHDLDTDRPSVSYTGPETGGERRVLRCAFVAAPSVTRVCFRLLLLSWLAPLPRSHFPALRSTRAIPADGSGCITRT
ncbi:hypothetical protein ACFQRF_27695, partial [Marinactinospora rubrisoli]